METSKINAAKKKVKDLKNWYVMVCIVIMGTISMYLFSNYIMSLGTPHFVKWILRGVPLIWWAVVLVHWLKIKNKMPNIIGNWEERQIKKIMEEDQEKTSEKYT